MKILVIEDDKQTADHIVEGLTEQKHEVVRVGDGREGLRLASRGNFDIAIVDRMLPGLDGLALVKGLRQRHISTAVLFLTNLGGLDDRVEGLEAGGDDYLAKPFAMLELLARVNALGRRRAHLPPETLLRVDGLELDLLKRRATRDSQLIDLLPREFKLLEYLMRNAGQVVTRTMLLEGVWDFHFDPKTNIVETHMSRLRAKVDRGFSTELIHTIRGAGYSLYADR
jgi:two-component system, OmpR family, response regulator